MKDQPQSAVARVEAEAFDSPYYVHDKIVFARSARQIAQQLDLMTEGRRVDNLERVEERASLQAELAASAKAIEDWSNSLIALDGGGSRLCSHDVMVAYDKLMNERDQLKQDLARSKDLNGQVIEHNRGVILKNCELRQMVQELADELTKAANSDGYTELGRVRALTLAKRCLISLSYSRAGLNQKETSATQETSP